MTGRFIAGVSTMENRQQSYAVVLVQSTYFLVRSTANSHLVAFDESQIEKVGSLDEIGDTLNQLVPI